MFKKILIANRGEIAVRVIRACRELGIRSVAIYSEVDRASLHVRKADEAYLIGPPAATESYLNIEKVIEVARKSGAEAIHPGYGFLSENAEFASACERAGGKFIGPTAAAMALMGSKISARQTVQSTGLPVVPGSSSGLELAAATRTAAEIGYPIMLKATAGGGGKGMRVVRSAEELPSAFENARSEAQRAFGDGELYIEKLIEAPRHIEMQILSDEHGNTIYLGERECSVQRRHQKVLEESPSPIVDPEMRQRMGETAVRIAQAAGYTNAGTVEFLVDKNKKFYFLEMNTRLQVEHPVTELITGLDLVHLQIRIAAGEALPLRQKDIVIRGHAIECRIYAEDPDNNFFPSPGKINMLLAPAGPGIRHDSGIYESWTVPIEYDPLLAKLIGYGWDRSQALRRMQRALSEYFVRGIKTNLSLFQRILQHPDFVAGRVDTGFLDRLLVPSPTESNKQKSDVAAIAAGLFAALEQSTAASTVESDKPSAARNGTPRQMDKTSSNWKRTARMEALR